MTPTLIDFRAAFPRDKFSHKFGGGCVGKARVCACAPVVILINIHGSRAQSVVGSLFMFPGTSFKSVS